MKATLMMLGTLLLTACASPTSSVLIGEKREPISSEQVTIYTQAPEGYEDVALLDVSSDGSWQFGDQAKMDAAIARLKEEAAKLGANGVLLQATGEKSDQSVSIGTGTGGYSGNVGFGLSIGQVFGLTDKTAQGMAIYVANPSVEESESDNTEN